MAPLRADRTAGAPFRTAARRDANEKHSHSHLPEPIIPIKGFLNARFSWLNAMKRVIYAMKRVKKACVSCEKAYNRY